MRILIFLKIFSTVQSRLLLDSCDKCDQLHSCIDIAANTYRLFAHQKSDHDVNTGKNFYDHIYTVVTHKSHTPNSHTYPNGHTFLASRRCGNNEGLQYLYINNIILYIFNPLVPLIGLIWLGIQNR